jgi:hypothetical protein
MLIQLSVGSEGGSGTDVPQLTLEMDSNQTALESKNRLSHSRTRPLI